MDTKQVLSQISPKIAKPAVFFFLREAFAPSIGQLMVRPCPLKIA
jgi:hypothetical protein